MAAQLGSYLHLLHTSNVFISIEAHCLLLLNATSNQLQKDRIWLSSSTMKLTAPIALALTASTVSAAALQPRHYLFPALSGTADWSVVRTTANHYSNGPVTDVSSSALRCYELTPGSTATGTQSVAAGSTVSFKVTPNIFRESL